jgi:hypothetical protein
MAMLSAIGADRTRLAHLEAEILDLERTLSALQTEQALVQHRLNSYKYPVLTLPNEIVSEIFVNFLPVYPQCPPLIGIFSPTSLTHICCQWREVALATPELWRAMELSYTRISSDRQCHITDTWLSRSRGCPLSIYIDEFDNQARMPEILSLISHCARWEHVKLCLTLSQLPVLEDSMPLLHYLDLELPRSQLAAPFAFPEAPLLRTAVLDDIAAAILTLPWAQLTSLTLRYVVPHDSERILRQTSNLVHCELYLCFDPDDEDAGVTQQPPDNDITLPRLESLVFKPSGNIVAGHLNALVVPALQRLETAEPYLGLDPIGSLASFLLKSGGCKLLRKVHIARRRIVQEDSYREAFPAIQFFA